MDKDHEKIWAAIDTIAKTNGMSVSKLAKTAGLDATAFNKSKRAYPSGKLRWPSTESVAKVIKSVHMNWSDFLRLVEKP